MFIRAKTGKGNSVVYYDQNENMVIRTGGSRAWRNNNPGNIRLFLVRSHAMRHPMRITRPITAD